MNPKNQSSEVAERLSLSKATEEKIDEARLAYKPVAFRVSLLFFCVSDLSLIENMYSFSLEWFIELFEESIAKGPLSSKPLLAATLKA